MSLSHYSVKPSKVEDLKQKIENSGWTLDFQDAGQNHFVGWGYMIQWQKSNSTLTLHYSEKQGVAEARIEMRAAENSSEAPSGILALIQECLDDTE